MAEGGGLTSLRDGSDADFDIECTPCGEDNIREEAVKYCPECQEYLCTTCTRHHGRLKATRSHNLQASYYVKQGSMVAMSRKCRFHPDFNIEMYCGAHDMVYCTKCIAKEHRLCDGVIDVEDIKPLNSTKKEMQRLQTDMRNFQERLIKIDKKTQKNIVSLKKRRDEIADEIGKVEQKLIEHIRNMKHEAVSNLIKEHDEGKNELKSTAIVVDDTRKEIENSIEKIQNLPYMDAREQFIHMKMIQNTLTNTGKLLAESEAKGKKTLCFTENYDLKTSIMTSTSLGRVHTETKRKQRHTPKSFEVKSKKEINVNMKNDKKVCRIFDICQLSDGTIILTDWDNRKIKRLDMNYNIKDHCDLDAHPSAICCTGHNEVAVKTDNDKVQFISLGSSLSKLKQISIEGGGVCGIGYYAGELWVSTGSSINIYSTSGDLLKTIDQNVFQSRTQHMAFSGKSLIVTDSSDGAVRLGIDGSVKGEVRDRRLDYTRGVCVSDDGTVFLSGYTSNNIVMFDDKGKCLGELVAEEAGLENPVSLCYDFKKNRLIVTLYSSDKILIFDI